MSKQFIMIPRKFHIDSKTFLKCKFGFAIEVGGFLKLISFKIIILFVIDFFICQDFSSSVTILCRKLFLLCRKRKAAEISNLFFLSISLNSCGIISLTFESYSIVSVECLVTPNISTNSFFGRIFVD